MTKSEIFIAAHKMAKAYKKKAGGFGDYIVYLQHALKNIIKKSKLSSAAVILKKLNVYLSSHGIEGVIRCIKNKSVRAGTINADKRYKIKAPKGKTIGKIFKSDNGFIAYVYEIRSEVEYY